VIPCYRQAHFLAQAVESALAQTYRNREILVIDDGSPDDVAGVLLAYPSVRCVRQENRGLAGARNRGLEECRGEFVAFLDADDRLLPRALEAGVHALESRAQCAFAWGFNRPIDVDGTLLPSRPKQCAEASYRRLLRGNVVGPPVGVLFRNSMVVAAGGFSSAALCEDYELYLRLARRHPSHCHGEVVAEYRYHHSNMSSDLTRMLHGMLLALEQQRPFVRKDRSLRRALAQGKKLAREMYDGEARLERLRGEVRAKRWGPATGTALGLLLKYPRFFLKALTQRGRSLIRGRTASVTTIPE
jgi:hypothetical protein